ncbi:DUF3152 domain-containing protein [Hoyosella altamirensis]|uniref:DUF3152 domain-containing protein n=1 Tax=Hoyosella altamirensis TaxID=616997 RepID=UPI001E4C6768|nr:DUF3152 domain-containing protein [Hoyosella altamirensis]
MRQSPWNQPLEAQWDPTEHSPGTADFHGEPEPPPYVRRRPPRGARRLRKRAKRSPRTNRALAFLRANGWRAYAVPMVALLIVAVTVFSANGSEDRFSSDQTVAGIQNLPMLDGGTSQNEELAPPPADGSFPDLPTGELPAGGPYTEHGTGEWRIVPGHTGEVGAGENRVFTYTVEIEEGVDTTSYGGDEAVTRMVDETLANPKSWIADPQFGFRRISGPEDGPPDFRVSLTSVMTVRQFCGYTIQLEVSCFSPRSGRVIINDARWVRGALAFQGDIGSYRQYLVNHEVGHAIGYPEHVPCESDGGLANVMMQQTLSTANNEIAQLDPGGVVPPDGFVCQYNAWPYPRAGQ